jgi:RecB family exonuclease
MFLEGQKIPPTPAASLGISLHRALERFQRRNLTGREALLGCYDEGWVGAGFPNPGVRDQFYQKGRRILERYFEVERDCRSEIVGIEREFVYPLGRHTVRGMVDRIDLRPDGSYEIIDYKTQLEFEKRSPIGENLQLRFYALGARESLAISPAWLTMYYLAAAKRETVPYDSLGEQKLKELIVETAKRIEAGDFAPDKSFCPFCAFRKTCSHSIARD